MFGRLLSVVRAWWASAARGGAGIAGAALAVLAPLSAFAHGGAVPVRGSYDWSHLPDAEPGAWLVWDVFGSIIFGCLAWIAFYAAMAGPIRKRYQLAEEGPTTREWGFFLASMLVVFGSLQGPLHELSDYYLFSGHMVQHLLITLVFPPLFILGFPGWMTRPFTTHRYVGPVGKFVAHPIMAFVIGNGALYFWHIPRMYDWALVNHDVHVVEHLMFMGSAVVMWWPVWSKDEVIPSLHPGMRMIYLFLLTVPMKALGAIITVSDYLLYEGYAAAPRVFGLDPLLDQRIGGLIMWLPAGLLIWGSIAAIFFTRYYGELQTQRQGSGTHRSSDGVPA